MGTRNPDDPHAAALRHAEDAWHPRALPRSDGRRAPDAQREIDENFGGSASFFRVAAWPVSIAFLAAVPLLASCC